MTPLMQAISKSVKKSRFKDEAGLFGLLKKDVGYFDISGIYDAAETVVDEITQMQDSNKELKFNLPYDVLWMEHNNRAVVYDGDLNESCYVNSKCSFKDLACTDEYKPVGNFEIDLLRLNSLAEYHEELAVHGHVSLVCIGALYMINTPNMVVNEPVSTSRLKQRRYAGRHRSLTNGHHIVKLIIDGMPVDCSACQPCQVTGKMPYHMVRGHIHRYWINGELQPKWIDAYWKGNPEVGTVSKTYETVSLTQTPLNRRTEK